MVQLRGVSFGKRDIRNSKTPQHHWQIDHLSPSLSFICYGKLSSWAIRRFRA